MHYARWRAHGDPTVVRYSARKGVKVEGFIADGEAECRHHGRHPDWSVRDRKDSRGRKYRSLSCLRCSRDVSARYRSNNPDYSRDYGASVRGSAVRLVGGARARSKQHGTPCTIDADWVVEQHEAQGGRCAYTGIPFSFEHVGLGRRRPYGMSLDQVAAGAGYTPDNTRLVLWIVNAMKRDLPLDEFVELCQKVVAQDRVAR
jgi:hypothetical protein